MFCVGVCVRAARWLESSGTIELRHVLAEPKRPRSTASNGVLVFSFVAPQMAGADGRPGKLSLGKLVRWCTSYTMSNGVKGNFSGRLVIPSACIR